jgi:uncharacterized membrane protein YecN with MAPEG domain
MTHPIGDGTARRRFIARSIWWTVPGVFLAVAAAYVLSPPMREVGDPGARLMMAVRWLVVALVPYVAVCVYIATARFFEGAHDPLAGEESERLKIHCRVMQNTLEQLVWFAICIIALATLVEPAEARVVPVLCVVFAVARFVYWWGYLRQGTLGRAPGVQMTFTINVTSLVVVVVLFVRSLVGPGGG